MSTIPPVPPGTQPKNWWRTTIWLLGTICAIIIVTLMGLAFSVIPAAKYGPGWQYTWHVLGAMLSFGCGLSMIWRKSAPQLVLLITGVGALVLPLDPIGPAIALTWVIAQSSKRTLAWAIPLASAAIGVPLWRDSVRGVDTAVFVSGDKLQPQIHLDPMSYVIVGIALFVVAISVGLARRWASKAHQATGLAAAASEKSQHLKLKLGRQEEHELIAREIHDTVAHQLSIVSLRAAALEVTSTDPTVPESARSIRASTHQALEEMRLLIHSLRDSTTTEYQGSSSSFNDINALIENVRSAGLQVQATLQFGEESPPPTLMRGVYRIVQEGLTNALRHAPDHCASLELLALSNQGVSILVSNNCSPMEPGSALAGQGAGAGILGMSERASALGGSLSCGMEDGKWVLRSLLPWDGQQ